MIEYPGSEAEALVPPALVLNRDHLAALLPRYIQSRLHTVIADVATSVDENPETFSNVNNGSLRALAQDLVWTATPRGTSSHMLAVARLLEHLRHQAPTREERFERHLHSEAHRKLNRTDINPTHSIRGFRPRCSEVVVAR